MWGLLADADRRRVFAALALGEGTVSGVAAASGVPVRKVMKALARLESAGVVSASGDHWELRTDVIEERARTEAGQGQRHRRRTRRTGSVSERPLSCAPSCGTGAW